MVSLYPPSFFICSDQDAIRMDYNLFFFIFYFYHTSLQAFNIQLALLKRTYISYNVDRRGNKKSSFILWIFGTKEKTDVERATNIRLSFSKKCFASY